MNTKPQFLLSKSGRKENLKGAFIFNKKYQDLIKNKNILIIDDVFTKIRFTSFLTLLFHLLFCLLNFFF